MVAGYPWRADVLVDALEATSDPIRPEALRALENIAGELRGTDPRTWRDWFRSLPGEAVAG